MTAQDSGKSPNDAAKLRGVIENASAMVSQRPPAAFSAKHLEQDLAKLLKSGSVEQHRDVLDRPQAASALAGAHVSQSIDTMSLGLESS